MNKRIRKIQLIKTRLHNVRDRNIRIKAELLILGLEIGVKEACSRRGFSRTFWYKWWFRLKSAQFDLREGLGEKSRRPRVSPKRTCTQLERKILSFAHKGYGAPTIQAHLQIENIKISQPTICKIIRGRKRAAPKPTTLKKHKKRYELLVPGQRVQVDVKYVPFFVDGRRVYNYVAVDECTRLRFIWPSTELNPHQTLVFLEGLVKSFPFKIQCIQTDNGFEFTNRLNPHGVRNMHPMTSWCGQKGIRHRLIPPGEKELNGKVERSHRIDEEFFYRRTEVRSFEFFKAAQEAWLRFYNNKRLHGGLGFITPRQKLLERQKALPHVQFLDPVVEKSRLEFIKSQPIPKTEKLTENLEKWLLKLKHSA